MPRVQANTVVTFTVDAIKASPSLTDTMARVDERAQAAVRAAGADLTTPPDTLAMVVIDHVFTVPEGVDAQSFIIASLRSQGLEPFMDSVSTRTLPDPEPSADARLTAWLERLPQDADPAAVTRKELWHMTGVSYQQIARLTRTGKLPGELRDGTWVYDLAQVAQAAEALPVFDSAPAPPDLIGPGYRRHCMKGNTRPTTTRPRARA